MNQPTIIQTNLPPGIKPQFVLITFLLALCIAPLVLPEFYVTTLNYIGIYALVALGLVLLTGIGGLKSFGQAAFVGLGAYSTAWLTATQSLPTLFAVFGQSPWLALLAGLILTTIAALVLGSLTLRLSGHYLPLSTIAWGTSLYCLLGNMKFLGGHAGLGGIPAIEIFGWELDNGRSFFYLIWAVLLVAMLTTRNLLDSRGGRNSGTQKWHRHGQGHGREHLALAHDHLCDCSIAACTSGWLYAHMQPLRPSPFGLNIGIEYLFMAVVGGAGHVWGALIGAGVITLLKQWLQDWLPNLLGQTGNFEVIVFGGMMILLLQRTQDGLWPILARLVPTRQRQKKINWSAEPLDLKPMPLKGEMILEVRNVTRKFGGLDEPSLGLAL